MFAGVCTLVLSLWMQAKLVACSTGSLQHATLATCVIFKCLHANEEHFPCCAREGMQIVVVYATLGEWYDCILYETAFRLYGKIRLI
jgi:hypothetical protein